MVVVSFQVVRRGSDRRESKEVEKRTFAMVLWIRSSG
jgi:hypothetical protein